ncbi:hypothetical protein Gotri_027607 [Gossypium trilobum]|uniref:Uncharacterized protein n=1 Tax=Gossypium trilobum TaxID=34281 RepID=A0A7J9FPZ3_9ROSI|nr:hypothetical protein [Gossypium trilobum]
MLEIKDLIYVFTVMLRNPISATDMSQGCYNPYTFSLITSHVGLSTEFEDIWLLLDQRSEADFEWTSYEDLTIQAIISNEFFVNPNTWHVKVPLVVYATVEMHEADRVL